MSNNQMSMKSYFSVRKRTGDHGNIKRRKIDDNTREDIPIITENTDLYGMNTINRHFVSSKPTDPSQSRSKLSKSTSCLQTPASAKLCKSPMKPPSSPIKVPSSPITAKQCQSPRKLLSSPITAKQCQSPRRLPSSPYRFETRGAAALRKALENTRQVHPTSPTERPSFQRFDCLAGPATPPVKSTPDTPSASTSDSPKLEKFELFEFTSPQKKTRASRRLNYSLLTKQTPTELKSNKATASNSKVADPSLPLAVKRPAYQRLSYLTDPPPPVKTTAASSSEDDGSTVESDTKILSMVDLTLPYSFQVLAERFKCVDAVCSMLQRRKEICTFTKLQKAVQKMTRRNFEKKNLGQIKFVYPEAFIFRQQKNIPGTIDKSEFSQYQLIVECTANEGENGGMVKKVPVGKRLEPTAFVKRKNKFNENLLNIVINHHKNFLASLDPPMEVPKDKLHRWHVSFQLDSVPEVCAAQLPESPITSISETCTTAKDILNISGKKVSDRVTRVLTKVAGRETEESSSAQSSCGVVNPVLKGVSSSLLERIRLKETARVKADMMRNPAKEKKLSMISRLPEMCRIIRSTFITEKKTSLLLEDVVKKITESHSSGLGTSETEEHVELLLAIQTKWIEKIFIRKTNYLKMKNVNLSMKDIVLSINDMAAELKAS